jgi:hypothetical protein
MSMLLPFSKSVYSPLAYCTPLIEAVQRSQRPTRRDPENRSGAKRPAAVSSCSVEIPIRLSGARRKTLEAVADYLYRNRSQMRYDELWHAATSLS